ncbi:MAG: resB [Amycolatopsis sp.]|uniref:cytochrome c biogenesis protein ResB n=1 Tax=Amycolatopsis sp. TaxID=37632 RepID=UPI00262E9FE2|nr:cytochrome c biogenesis protein ResB [Amycolatopsis sp.]MCU1685983.1 resB [Amycolatopsis sp.]
MTTVEAPPAQPEKPYRPTLARRVLAFLRNTWRGLTSMRTALVLLFLLALGALPGALLPQRALNGPKTDAFIASHGWWGTLLDKLEFFTVYSSIWFSAIYLLLMISLVGCLVPRLVDYVRAIGAKPVLTPRNLSRMPHYHRAVVKDSPDEVMAAANARLSRWRHTEREETGSRSLSAERGYLRETGNLIFHFSMLGLIIFFALGKMFGYSGQVIVQADGSQFCNAGILGYDSFDAGLRVDGTQLDPWCVKINDFKAQYTENGEPIQYESSIDYQSGDDLKTGTWRPYDLKVNSPLRTAGDRVYLLGNGFSPKFTVTYPNGEQRSMATQWAPVDQTTLLSQGATKFEPPGITDEAVRRTKELAVTGVFAPSAFIHANILTSAGPQLTLPAVAVNVMRGDLGTDNGQGQSIFSVDQSMVADGRLKQVARQNLFVGQTITLDDKTQIRFDGVQRWVSLQISHDPTQDFVLFFAITMLIGLGGSLLFKRRRVWVRVIPAEDPAGGTVVEIGGLARTDQAGYGEEFGRIAEQLASGRKGT